MQQTTFENIMVKVEIAYYFYHTLLNSIQLYNYLMIFFHIFAKMCSKSYAADLLYVGKGEGNIKKKSPIPFSLRKKQLVQSFSDAVDTFP